MSTETIWIGIGFLGQGLFFGRWLVQWITSERNAESRVPVSFWYMSLIGGLITLTYAIYRMDPVFYFGTRIGDGRVFAQSGPHSPRGSNQEPASIAHMRDIDTH